ncbi:N-acetyl-gamma-glutamyl-phosphate reductase [Vulcanisaeta souniana]|uniref:Putative [LysW]-L-2-aminoadipate/[LysW]-L-glutamate phosphate reductase n=1 Tax=Vulcanisaeta souniana JCM 11219 TaxID=1293586 RepID=A0A830E245_9CREN|nr:N-acetyl-gamma-glutamyl-phosphate reductase [Vulcanisaeta souniana]BDR92335.1 N-acetyl-gamma-glutamyl-phosphate reductase [Vulcanisaeta souniana JCM 11219]GGI74798.1 N-acetyl-gamma-glutamyl-phosphate reductase [Vulcanisaeta souniana JCM 11219]
MARDRYRTCVVGASGVTGGELLRLLLNHQGIELVCATSREFKGEYLFRIHPNLRGRTNLTFIDSTVDNVLKKDVDVVFLALPHGQSIEWVPKLHETGLTVIDLSADFRLKDPNAYVEWYDWEKPHPYPDLLRRAVYGLPELHREELKGTKLIAVPGCMATASIISLAPVVRAGLVDTDRIVIDAKISSSGAGAHAPRLDLHPFRTYVIRPYEVVHHRHTAEIEQELSLLINRQVRVAFTPHAVDLVRGILTTSHAWLTKPVQEPDVWKALRSMYGNEPFIRLVKDRSGLQRYPDVKYVIGSNLVDVGFEIDNRLNRLVVLAAIDNLMKGASGQAVQAMNVALGFPETTALDQVPLYPV